MNTNLAAVMGVVSALVAANVEAAGAFTGRVGGMVGKYNFEDEFNAPPAAPEKTKADSTTYGGLLGARLNAGRFFGDLGLEYSKLSEENSNERTDLLTTIGLDVGDRWSLFAGYRYALFGDGFFDDTNGVREVGPYAGIGVSFQPGQRLAMGISLAVNSLSLKSDDPSFQAILDDVDLLGYSFKLQFNLLDSPHSVFLRVQDFEGDTSQPGFTYDYSERYYVFGYQMTFDIASW